MMLMLIETALAVAAVVAGLSVKDVGWLRLDRIEKEVFGTWRETGELSVMVVAIIALAARAAVHALYSCRCLRRA